MESWILARDRYLYAKVKITRLHGTNMRSNDKATLTNNEFHLLRNAKYTISGKYIESIDYVAVTTTVKNLLEFSDDYSRSAVTNMLCYEDKTQSVDSFQAENDFESTFTPLAGGGGTITTKRNNAFNGGLFKRLNKTKECHVVSIYLLLPRLLGFCQDINRVY